MTESTNESEEETQRDMLLVEFKTLVYDRLPRVFAIMAVITLVAFVGMYAVTIYNIPAAMAFLFGMLGVAVIEPFVNRLRTWERGL